MNALKQLARREGSQGERNRALSEGKRNFSNSNESVSSVENQQDVLSPELVPVVTLFSSQAHRRYNEGILMLYYDLNGEGNPAERVWHEVYGILTGNQLAYWDAGFLAKYRGSQDALTSSNSKPSYLNFTDAIYSPMHSLSAAKGSISNVIVVSTTLKNRYLLQFRSGEELAKWCSSLRLSTWEYSSLQSAYTGALLSARGSRLSDIRTILAEKRFDHEDWVSIRYGSGMAWKRCFAVIEPSQTKRKKFIPGRVLFYQTEKKKKKELVAVLENATSVVAVYPQTHMLIDQSTMLKVEASINFESPSVKSSKKQTGSFRNTAIFLMPEAHSSVPGFDTLIRFMIPLFDAFGLYGRPKRLKADRIDPDSLLYGLPTLPRVHYLEVDDVLPLTSRSDYLAWEPSVWSSNIKSIMSGKLQHGYTGCGSNRGYAAAAGLASNGSSSGTSIGSKVRQTQGASSVTEIQSSAPSGLDKNIKNLSLETSKDEVLNDDSSLHNIEKRNPHDSVQLAEIYQKYTKMRSPSEKFNTQRNRLLNGSAENIIDDDLPTDIQNMTIANRSHDMYPTESNLFSDEDEEELEFSEDTGSDAGSRSSKFSGDNLAVPTFRNRDSSYSSVASPMTNYNDFNSQFKQTVGDHGASHSPKRDISESNKPTDSSNPKSYGMQRSQVSSNLSESVARNEVSNRGSPKKPIYPVEDLRVRDSQVINPTINMGEIAKSREALQDTTDSFETPQQVPIVSSLNQQSRFDKDHPQKPRHIKSPPMGYNKSPSNDTPGFSSSYKSGHNNPGQQTSGTLSSNSNTGFIGNRGTGAQVPSPQGPMQQSDRNQAYKNAAYSNNKDTQAPNHAGPSSHPYLQRQQVPVHMQTPDQRNGYNAQLQYRQLPQAPPQKQEYPNSYQYGYQKPQHREPVSNLQPSTGNYAAQEYPKQIPVDPYQQQRYMNGPSKQYPQQYGRPQQVYPSMQTQGASQPPSAMRSHGTQGNQYIYQVQTGVPPSVMSAPTQQQRRQNPPTNDGNSYRKY